MRWYAIKKWENVPCLGAQRGEGCLVINDLVDFFKAEKRKVNVGDAQFRLSALSLSLS